jgi:TfoX/Sxy family transcriptional regulator of competence genes
MAKETASRKNKPAAKPRRMPKWTKAPASLVAAFTSTVKDMAGVDQRKMFGYPAAFANAHMFAGLFEDKMIVRLDESDRAALRSQGGVPFEPMPGRPMREYLVVPTAVAADAWARRAWCDKAYAYAVSLPPKAKRR